jgi:sorbitol-specific phosphotransferase system component IIBC
MEEFTKQNEDMYKQIEQSTIVEDVYVAPVKQEFVTSYNSTSNNNQLLQESEMRHSAKIESLYSQISSQESKFMSQIS